MRVTVPVAAAARLLIAVDGHAAQRHLELHGWARKCEWKCGVERFFRERWRLDDVILDVDPLQLVVQCHDRRERGKSLERTVDNEPHTDSGQLLTPAFDEFRLRDGELGRILEVVAVT